MVEKISQAIARAKLITGDKDFTPVYDNGVVSHRSHIVVAAGLVTLWCRGGRSPWGAWRQYGVWSY